MREKSRLEKVNQVALEELSKIIMYLNKEICGIEGMRADRGKYKIKRKRQRHCAY